MWIWTLTDKVLGHTCFGAGLTLNAETSSEIIGEKPSIIVSRLLSQIKCSENSGQVLLLTCFVGSQHTGCVYSKFYFVSEC